MFLTYCRFCQLSVTYALEKRISHKVCTRKLTVGKISHFVDHFRLLARPSEMNFRSRNSSHFHSLPLQLSLQLKLQGQDFVLANPPKFEPESLASWLAGCDFFHSYLRKKCVCVRDWTLATIGLHSILVAWANFIGAHSLNIIQRAAVTSSNELSISRLLCIKRLSLSLNLLASRNTHRWTDLRIATTTTTMRKNSGHDNRRRQSQLAHLNGLK